MLDSTFSVNGVTSPCLNCKYNSETDGTCTCKKWETWFKAYWRELRRKYLGVKK